MFGFFIGTLCLVALVVMFVRHRRQMYGYGGGCGHFGKGWGRGWGGGWHGHHHGGWGGGFVRGGGGFERFFLRGLFQRLETTPGQEKVIVKAVDDVRTAIRDARGEVDKTREDVKNAFGADNLDESALAGAFIRQDDEIAKVRKALVGALAEVHGALDERQRRELADILADFPRGGGWRDRGFRARDAEGGPYRA